MDVDAAALQVKRVRRENMLDFDTGDRFRFGENWQSFVETVSPETIAEADAGLRRLFPNGEVRESSFLDVGCGSGLSSLAALRLGAETVDAIDIDPLSVAASTALLSKFAPGCKWTVRQENVLKLPQSWGERSYDIVYSWGVLHHTGAMWRAIEQAAALVAPQGYIALALYRRTPMCPFWAVEKRFYVRTGRLGQRIVREAYKGLYCAGLMATGRSPRRYLRSYKSARGMDWHHDVHDWLGGYPYESTDPASVLACLGRLGFVPERVSEHRAAVFGVFGSHCDEYVARRK